MVPALLDPNQPDDDGLVNLEYDPVLESARRVGRVLHEFGDAILREAVRTDVEGELQAVDMAERGELDDRAAQAVVLSRVSANSAQVDAADALLRVNPLDYDGLRPLDPTAASVAASPWLKSAVDVAAKVSSISPYRVLAIAADEEGVSSRQLSKCSHCSSSATPSTRSWSRRCPKLCW